MTASTLGTLVLEISFPFLVWRPRLRWLMICGGILLVGLFTHARRHGATEPASSSVATVSP